MTSWSSVTMTVVERRGVCENSLAEDGEVGAAGVRSGRGACGYLNHNHTIRGSERRLRGRLERLAIEVIAVGDRRERLINPQLWVEQLHLDRLAVGKRDDRANMNLVARIRV